MPHVSLHELIRPSAHRDDCGEIGEAMHKLADIVELHHPGHTLQVSCQQSPLPTDWLTVKNCLAKIGLLNEGRFITASTRIQELATTK